MPKARKTVKCKSFCLQCFSAQAFDGREGGLSKRLPRETGHAKLGIDGFPVFHRQVPLNAMLAWGQVRLLQHFLQRKLKYWVPLTVVGTLLGALLDFILPVSISYDQTILFTWFINTLLLNAPIFVVPAIAQWALLRRYLRHAWLWIAASIGVSGIFSVYTGFQQARTNLDMLYPAWVTFNIAASVVTGLVMLLMVFLARRDEYTLADSSSDEDADISRLMDEAKDSQADEAPLSQRRAQSY